MSRFLAKDQREFKTEYLVKSVGYHNVRHALAFYEVAGVLVPHGSLDGNLLFVAADIA